jgi:hypothetical protein
LAFARFPLLLASHQHGLFSWLSSHSLNWNWIFGMGSIIIDLRDWLQRRTKSLRSIFATCFEGEIGGLEVDGFFFTAA